MKKQFHTFVFLITLALLTLFLLSGCADIPDTPDRILDEREDSSPSDPPAETPVETPVETPRYYVSAQRDPSVEYITCKKTQYSAEKQAMLDQYYDQMVLEFPKFGEIPREMLLESVSNDISDDKFFEVTFTFCFGGRPTGCRCTFSREPRATQGKWELEEDEFKKFYQSGLTSDQMAELQKMVRSQINERIEKYKLDKNDRPSGMYLYVVNGEPCAQEESIADVTVLTTKEFGCGDHAHLFGTVILDVETE